MAFSESKDLPDFGFTENLIDRKILAFPHYDDKINFISKPFRYEKSIHFLENT